MLRVGFYQPGQGRAFFLELPCNPARLGRCSEAALDLVVYGEKFGRDRVPFRIPGGQAPMPWGEGGRETGGRGVRAE